MEHVKEYPEEKDIKGWLSKMKKSEFDLSRDEDLSIALMNLISLEEHFYFTAMKTGNKAYLDMLNSVRTLRKTLLRKIVKNPKGEEWCISKHLLAASMRLMEVGTKELGNNDEKEAELFFKAAFELHSLFFALNLNMIEIKEIKEDKSSFPKKITTILAKIVDCCKE